MSTAVSTLPADLVEELVATRRDLHVHPELSFQEQRTAGIVAQRLRALGIEVTEGVAQTGVVGILKGGAGDGPVLMLRADMDALPILEDSTAPYKSQTNGVMHACGHDGHVAILLAAARVLAAERESLKGTVKFCFQPAEEGFNGAEAMVKDGVLSKPTVDLAYGLHLWADLPTGRLAVAPGAVMAAVDEFELVVRGVGGHGAMPHQAADPIVAASHVVTALQTVVSRNVSPLESAVVTVGQFTAGTAFNIIAESATLRGTVRSFDRAVWEALPEQIERVIKGVTAGLGCTYTLAYKRINRATVNHAEPAARVTEIAREYLGADKVVTEGVKTMGGEDMSVYLEHVPGCFFFLGARDVARKITAPHHSPRFDIDEGALPLGVELFRRIVRSHLTG
jgi:amidohydrolase